MRSRGRLDDHPTLLNAIYRMRLVMLGKNPGMVQKQANTNVPSSEDFVMVSHANNNQSARRANVMKQDEKNQPDPSTNVMDGSNDFFLVKNFLGDFELEIEVDTSDSPPNYFSLTLIDSSPNMNTISISTPVLIATYLEQACHEVISG